MLPKPIQSVSFGDGQILNAEARSVPMIATHETILKFIPVMTAGILFFDVVLNFFNKPSQGGGGTISHTVVTSRPWVQIVICIAQCVLILHFWTDFLG